MSAIRAAIILVVGVVGMIATFHPTLRSGFTRMQPDPGDVVLNNYFLEHTFRWAFVRDDPHSFWSPGIFYPTPDTFTYSETLVGMAPVYWLLRAVMDETLAAQWWILLMTAGNYGACVVVLRWFKVHVPLACAGAYVFAFGLVRTDHLTHQQLLPHVFGPFIVWHAWQMLHVPSVRRWAILVGLLTWQVFASLHLGWFLWFGLVVFVGLACGFVPEMRQRMRTFAKEHWRGLLVPVVLAAVVVGLYASNFYRGAPERRTYGDTLTYAPLPDCWFVAVDDSIWRDHLTPRVSEFAEVRLFQGFTAYLILVLAAWQAYRQREQRVLIALGVGTAFLLALSVTVFAWNMSLWAVVHFVVPGANAFRAISRITFAAMLFGSIGGLVGVQEWLQARGWSPRKQLLVASLMLVGVMVEQTFYPRESFDKEEQCYGPSREFATLLQGADVGYIQYDGMRPDYRHHITAMWAGLYANVPMMNGFSGSSPRGYPALGDQPTLEELLTHLGENWEGTFVLLEWGPPKRRYVYRITKGPDPTTRYVRVE